MLGFDRYKAQSNEADRYIKGVAQWLARFVRDPEVYKRDTKAYERGVGLYASNQAIRSKTPTWRAPTEDL